LRRESQVLFTDPSAAKSWAEAREYMSWALIAVGFIYIFGEITCARRHLSGLKKSNSAGDSSLFFSSDV
jgi:hypothetical protein